MTTKLLSDHQGSDISIHTLTWRVTMPVTIEELTYQISIHTLTWRVTRWLERGDGMSEISIHTLTWRVT